MVLAFESPMNGDRIIEKARRAMGVITSIERTQLVQPIELDRTGLVRFGVELCTEIHGAFKINSDAANLLRLVRLALA